MNPWIQTHKRDLMIAGASIVGTLAIVAIVFAIVNLPAKTELGSATAIEQAAATGTAADVAATTTAPAATTPTATSTITTTKPAVKTTTTSPAVKTTTVKPTTTKPTTVTTSGTVRSITATASVSDYAPNDRETVTITSKVKDNNGRAVTSATVTVMVGYRQGTQGYKMTSRGSGVYTAGFVMGSKSYPGYRVTANVTATYQGKTATASTSFIPSNY